MADSSEAVKTKVVSDLCAAVRGELNHLIPVLLSPLVEEFKDLKNALGKDQNGEKLQISFRDGCSPAPVVTAPKTEPSSFDEGNSDGCHKANKQDATFGGPQSRTDIASPTSGMEMETTPLVDPAVAPQAGCCPWSWRPMWGPKTSAREGYHLTPRCESADDPVVYSHMLDTDIEEHDDPPLTDPEAAKRLPDEIAALEEQAHTVTEALEDLDTLWKNRRSPYEEDMAQLRKEIDNLQDELEHAKTPKEIGPPPPGPVALKFADHVAFGAVCNLVVLANLTCMIIQPKFKRFDDMFKVADHVFLAWYVVELTVKGIYYQHDLICGKISVVWWNWLDLGIVVSGVVDQWLMPLLTAMNGGHLDIDISALRALRLLRLFRILRFLKIIKAFLKSDFAWTEDGVFESLMAGVIFFNSIVMSVELDIPWVGWPYVENFLQIVYTFELACRLKRQAGKFFTAFENMVWNYLDFVMVAGGALDLWLVPLIDTLQGVFTGKGPAHRGGTFSGVLKILKIMRILRVLRLVRLLKMVHPLYKLLMGVIVSIQAMQWVLILTFLTLYACAIVFTNLVGHGLMNGGEISSDAHIYFGTVPSSLFSLFKLMNGDMSVVAPITGSVTGQLLFACFMVVSNWAILAVLTAVVSDNMITTSAKANEEEEQKKRHIDYNKRIRRLTALFREIDEDGQGTISTTEWQRMLDDRTLQRELCDASGLHQEDLNEYFDCLAKDPKQQERDKMRKSGQMTDLSLDYNTFMEALKDEGALADKRSILHVLKHVRMLETQVKREFDALGRDKRRGSLS